MLPKKYHAILFISILVMLLLLGLHLLGIGFSSSSLSSQAAARSAALARNSTSSSSSSSSLAQPSSSSSNSQQQVYRHPIIYDKLTGATNNQINDVLGAKQPLASDYPIDHYQQQQQQQQQQQPAFGVNPLGSGGQDDFFANIHRQSQPPALPPGFPPHPLTHHHLMQLPAPQLHQHHHMMTTLPPASSGLGNQQQQQVIGAPLPPLPPPPPPPQAGANQRQSIDHLPLTATTAAAAGSQLGSPAADSIPSASSNNGNARPLSNNTSIVQQQQQPPMTYYTPPIFAYNQFDQPQQSTQFNQPPPMGIPEPPMTFDEYNARQNNLGRLRQINNQQQQQQPISINEIGGAFGGLQKPSSIGSSNKQQQPNLLADPQQQQLHKQQMLDRQILFGGGGGPIENQTQNYYPDPAIYRNGPSAANLRLPPYAHSMSTGGVGGGPNQVAQNRVMQPQQQQQQQQQKPQQLIKSMNQAPIIAPQQQLVGAQAASSSMPLCASKQVSSSGGNELLQQRNLELVNSSAQMPVLFCNDDPDYPTKDIMRALEIYASERSIEQILPQPLVQLHLATTGGGGGINQQRLPADIQRQITLDSLQPSINGLTSSENSKLGSNELSPQGNSGGFEWRPGANLFPSANYEPMCRSTNYLAQPKRAKNLLGQWKIIVNLPGHKYRGIAISQMVRIEECSRPNSECNTPSPSASGLGRSTQQQAPTALVANLLPKSRCLQHYENQRLVAWSHQQGLHLDIFRVPIACSCHIRR